MPQEQMAERLTALEAEVAAMNAALLRLTQLTRAQLDELRKLNHTIATGPVKEDA